MAETIEGWEGAKKILVILAHPDDPEFFCGASIARWADQGNTVEYCLLTRGDKGSTDPNVTPIELAALREQEQIEAARVLGVETVRFLDYRDGELVPNLEMRAEVVQIIREMRPDIIVGCDPTFYFPGNDYINHPDHRAAGQVVVDSANPAPHLPNYFPEQIRAGLKPHRVQEVWLTLTGQPDVVIDVSEYWNRKLEALLQHKSQVGDPETFKKEMSGWHTADSTPESPRYTEGFRRFIFFKDHE